MQTIPGEELSRGVLWLKARQDKNGNFKDPATQAAADRIVSVITLFLSNFYFFVFTEINVDEFNIFDFIVRGHWLKMLKLES